MDVLCVLSITWNKDEWWCPWEVTAGQNVDLDDPLIQRAARTPGEIVEGVGQTGGIRRVVVLHHDEEVFDAAKRLVGDDGQHWEDDPFLGLLDCCSWAALCDAYVEGFGSEKAKANGLSRDYTFPAWRNCTWVSKSTLCQTVTYYLRRSGYNEAARELLTTVRVAEDEGEGEEEMKIIYEGYPRGNTPACVYLDVMSGELLIAGAGAYNMGAILREEWRGRILAWDIPSLVDEAETALLTKIAPLAQRILDGATVSSGAATFTDEANAARDEVQELCNAAFRDHKNIITTEDAAAFLGSRQCDILDDVRAESTDQELQLLAEQLENEFTRDDAGLPIVLRGTMQYLLDLRAYVAGEGDEDEDAEQGRNQE